MMRNYFDEPIAKNSFDFKTFWLESKYPLTIIKDRYAGTYSGGNYIAFPNYYYEIPSDGPNGGDLECSDFWGEYNGFVGLGLTPSEALINLENNIKENIRYERNRYIYN